MKDIYCELKHFPLKKQEAINYLIQQFEGFTIQIPICQECADALYDKDWVLLYCVTCASSQWVYLPNCKKPHLYKVGEHIKWMDGCPECTRKGG